MVQNTFNLLSFTEMPVINSEGPLLFPESSESATESDIQTNSVTSEPDTSLSVPETEVMGTESELQPNAEVVQETVYLTGEYDAQILFELQVTNNLLGHMFAMQVFMIACFFLVFFIKLLKNNVTKLYT